MYMKNSFRCAAIFSLFSLIFFISKCTKSKIEEPAMSVVEMQDLENQQEVALGKDSASSISPYSVRIAYKKRVGNDWVWIWEIKNRKPGNGENNTVQNLSSWGIDLGDCIGLGDIVESAYSNDKVSWTTFTPTFEVDPSQNCSEKKYLKFNFGTSGSTSSYYKLVISKQVDIVQTEALFNSGSRCGLFVTCGFGCEEDTKSSVDLGTACDFSILAKTGISTTGSTSITGDIGVSPIAATAITGFGLVMDPTNQFSITPIVAGKVYAADYSNPTPAKMTKAINDMETAYTTANGLVNPSPTVGLLISGKTLKPGIYKYSTDLAISNAGVTLNGGPNDQWIFQVAGDLNVSNSAIINLTGGAQAKNIFWVVAGQAVLGTSVDFKGTVLSKSLISLNSGSKVTGKLYAQTAVTLISSTVIPTPCLN
jgi:hypothetical protein